MSRNLSEVYPPREYTAADIGAVGLTGDQDISGAKNFLGDMKVGGFPIHPLEADLTITVGVGGEPETINGCLAKYSRMYPAYVVDGAIFTLHLPAGFVMAEQVLVRGIDLSHWQITGADAETTITRSALSTEFEERYPTFGATNGGRLPLIAQLFDMDTTGTATNRDGVYVYGAGSVANVASACGIKNAGEVGAICRGGDVYMRSSVFTGCNICAQNIAGRVYAQLATLSGGVSNGVLVNLGGRMTVQSANCQKGASPDSSDIVVLTGGYIDATSVTGGINQTKNIPTANGIIYQA